MAKIYDKNGEPSLIISKAHSTLCPTEKEVRTNLPFASLIISIVWPPIDPEAPNKSTFLDVRAIAIHT